MKTFLSLVSFLIFSFLYSQLPGGVGGIDMWYKTGTTVPLSIDYGPNAYPITRTGAIQADLFNYNHSLKLSGANNIHLNFPYSVEDMDVATIFMVYINTGNANSSLMYSNWRSGAYQGNGENEKQFFYSTNNLKKKDFSLAYPEEEYEIPNALINTLNWFDFNSKKINNEVGTGGESTMFVGRNSSTPAMSAFKGLIPEFIIYRKALSKEERQRVESYLAIKYGITLTPEVGYYNSKYETIWDKENNTLFGNRIIAIGREDASLLYQKQSTSSHTTEKEFILNAGELAANNESNAAILEDNHFIFVGDNGLLDNTSENVGDWDLHRIERKWLVHPFGENANDIETELRFKASHLINKIHQDYDAEFWDDITIWLLIDRSADESEVVDFSDLSQVEYYMYDALEGNNIVYNDKKWDIDNTGFDQFTLAIGPKMLVDVSLQEMECEDTVGDINVQITFGEPDFDFEIVNQDNPTVPVASQSNWATRTISFTDLPNGWYTLRVEDTTGYERTIDFEVSPTAGMYINLEDEYLLEPNLSLDASEDVYVLNVTYQWYRNGDPFSNDAEIDITKTGIYRVVLTNENGCQVEDTTYVVDENGDHEKDSQSGEPDDSLAKETIKIYPNPTKINQEFTVEINLLEKQDVLIQIHDYSGSLIHSENLKDTSSLKWKHRLFQSGSYLISVTTKNQNLTKQLIIQ